MEEKPDRKKTKKANYSLQHVRRDFWFMMDEELLDSFITEVPIMQKPVH